MPLLTSWKKLKDWLYSHVHDGVDGSTKVAHASLSGIGAADHHARYTDAEAVTAMGAKAAANPLHHDIYTDGEAVAAAKADGDISDAIAKKHTRTHAITSTSDHTSAATPGRMLKGDANGLPVDATNTDAEVAAAITGTRYLREAAAGKRILIAQIPLGAVFDSVDITATAWTLYGNLFAMGKDNSWWTDLVIPSITGWTARATFAARVGYDSGANTVYISLYNRTRGSQVTGSTASTTTNATTAGFGLRKQLESGYLTLATNDLNTAANDGYQFYCYNSAAGKTIQFYYQNLNVYLVKD